MTRSGFRRGTLIAIAAFVVGSSPVRAQTTADDVASPRHLYGEPDLILPDGRPLPELPVTVSGRVQNDALRVTEWRADLATQGDTFEGKITFPAMPVVVPLTVQGTRNGDIVEFFVRAGANNVAYFAGHLAGTSLVGTFDGITGEKGNWNGFWIPETYEVKAR
jgi:hypothetical protein